MNKQIEDDQVDLYEIILSLWNDKWKIVFSIISAVILMMIYLSNQKPTIILSKATTEIKPISIFDEFKYDTYNSYLDSISKKKLEETMNLNKDELNSQNFKPKDNSSFKYIDKTYLHDLFIDRLDENSIFIDGIKKFNLINKENYSDVKQYESAVTKLAASIRLIKGLQSNINRWSVQTVISDRETWEKFLNYVNESTNKEIQIYLSKIFDKTILNEKKFIEYQIEDIEIELESSSNDENIKNSLTKKRALLETNKDLERIKDLFKNTPIVTSENFYAGKIMVLTTKYENLNSAVSKTKMLVIAIIIGGVFGIFLALISNAIRKKEAQKTN